MEYEYLDKQPQVGDIVEMKHDWSQYGQPIGKLSVVLGINKKYDTIQIMDNRDLEDSWYAINYVKVVKTKPHAEMKKGDHFIRIKKDGAYSTGTVHTAYYDYGEGMYKKHLYYNNNCSVYPSEVLVLCKVEPNKQPIRNPFRVGDTIRSISNDNPTDRPYDKVFTVKKIHDTDVYYKDGYAAHYSKFEIVQSTPKLLHQKWKDLYDQGVELEFKTSTSGWYNVGKNRATSTFNSPEISYRVKHNIQETVKNQTKEENKMTFTQLIESIFGQELTDYEKRPNFMVIAFNRDGSEKAITSAESIEQVTKAVQSNPELWGCKLVTYKMSKEVFTEVPVTVTKSVK